MLFLPCKSIHALKAATSIAAELLGRGELGMLAPGKLADIVAMPEDSVAALQFPLKELLRPDQMSYTQYECGGQSR